MPDFRSVISWGAGVVWSNELVRSHRTSETRRKWWFEAITLHLAADLWCWSPWSRQKTIYVFHGQVIKATIINASLINLLITAFVNWRCAFKFGYTNSWFCVNCTFCNISSLPVYQWFILIYTKLIMLVKSKKHSIKMPAPLSLTDSKE